MLRAAPGPQLSQGRLRVDAARAIAKLREYQLVDRTTWILEAVRAAVASKATAIRVAADSNDVWLSWEGPVWPAEHLPRLFDELVSPEPAQEHHHLRLLATAVNTALGLEPAHVDIIALAADGSAERVRYKPDVLENTATGATGHADDSPLRLLAVEPIPRDARWPAPPTGMLVHYRRSIGLDVLLRFARIRNIPELEHVRRACELVPVPLTFGETTLSRGLPGRDLVRVPLGEPLDGFLAIVDPSTLGDFEPIVMEVAERGVILASHPISVIDLGQTTHAVPIRAFVDAPRLPTNASRSEVRRDAHPLPLAEERAKQQAPALLEALRERLATDPETPALRRAALQLIASSCSDHTKLARLGSLLGGLPDLPLVRNACGQDKPVARAWRGFVHDGRSPMPADLAPWMHDVLWVPDGDPARMLVSTPIERAAFRRHARWARRQLKAKEWFYGHEPRPARVATSQPPLVRMTIGAPFPGSCVYEVPFANVTGEVCLFANSGPGEIVFLLEGRELDRTRHQSSLGVSAVVDDPRVTPGDRYRSVARDEQFVRIEVMVRDASIRAAEALAAKLAGMPVPEGYDVVDPDPARDIPIIIRAIAARGALPQFGPFVSAKLWQLRDGTHASLDALREHAVIAIAGPDAYVPPNRPAVVAHGTVLAKLVGKTRVISYDGLARGRPTAQLGAGDLAMLLLSSCEHVFAIDEGASRLRGAIGIVETDAPSKLFHAGVELSTWNYTASLLPAVIAIDADDVIPDDTWQAAIDDAGITRRDFKPWEIELARAIARALVGERDASLFGGPLSLESAAARALFAAFAKQGPSTLLGVELAAKLRAYPMLQLLGDPRQRSIDELAELFPWGVHYVPDGLSPEPDFTPLVASARIAGAVAALAGRPAIDGTDELERRRRERERADRLAKHRALPETKVQIPYTVRVLDREVPHVQVQGSARGQVGVSHAGLELHVFVERRRFEVVRRPDDLPLLAALDIGVDGVNETFEALPESTVDALVQDVRSFAEMLITTIAEREPAMIGAPGPVRALLARWLRDRELGKELRAALRDARAFRSVQGKLVSIDEARRNELVVVGEWGKEWLSGDLPHEHDRPVIDIDTDELRTLVTRIHGGTLRDVTDELARVQAQRQMAKGLLPVPQLPAIEPALKRTFAQLGVATAELGFGEIGLADDDSSRVFIHAGGQHRETVKIDLQPSVHVAIEAPDLIPQSALSGMFEELNIRSHPVEQLVPRLRSIAIALIKDVTRGALHRTQVARLRRAVLAGDFDGTHVAEVLMFETIDGSLASWSTFEAQRVRFGVIWTVPERTGDRPMDPERIVFVLSKFELELAQRAHVRIVDARRDLMLDAMARKNRERPRATSLAIPAASGLLATVELRGGDSAPRGFVAALAPDAAHRRIVMPHREMHPFDPVADPCQWPTLAVIDDARITPDRLWQAPAGDAIWTSIVDQIRAASDRALKDAVPVPVTALASERLTNLSHDGLPSLKAFPKTRIRGALWIVGAPRASTPVPRIRIVASDGERGYPLEQFQGLTGTLFIHAPDGFHEDAIRELCAAVYTRLVRSMLGNRDLDRDVVLAHALHGLALRRLVPLDVRNVTFPCFVPSQLDAHRWLALLDRKERVPIVEPGKTDPTVLAIVDDGSELSRIARAWCDMRVTFEQPVGFEPSSSSAASPSAPWARPTVAATPEPTPKYATPMEQLALAVMNRLVALDVPRHAFEITTARSPIISYDDCLRFAGEHPQLKSIAAAVLANTAWASDALDALAAHALTVMNVALADVTDATEINGLGKLLDNA